LKKALVLVAIILFMFIGLMLTPNAKQEDKPYIAVTNFALYEIASKITQGKVGVKNLIPFGAEVHSYMPSVKTMTQILKAKLFVFNGLSMEPWIKKEYKNQLNMSEYMQLHSACSGHEHEGPQHSNEDSDPHYWLDLENMKIMTAVLDKKLSAMFPQDKEFFHANAEAYIKALTSLDKEYSKTLQNCKQREIVVNHNAFAYLSARYDFHTHWVTGLSADEQVSAKKMKEITDLVKEEKIKTIFFESFASDKVALTIAKETGAKVSSLQPLANVTQEEASRGYIVLMQENLKKLSKAMSCQ
jgi:zinc transport system substrate-binding protein